MGKSKYKILAVVKMNGGEAFVLDKKIELQYTKYGNVIIGTDGCFMNFFYYERPYGRLRAFAGRKFDLPLTDGSVVHCDGQWWDGKTEETLDILQNELGIKPKDIIGATAQDVTSLERCYVYGGYRGVRQKIKKLRDRIGGRVYEYWEYETLLKNGLLKKQIKLLNAALDKFISDTTGTDDPEKIQKFKEDLINQVKEVGK